MLRWLPLFVLLLVACDPSEGDDVDGGDGGVASDGGSPEGLDASVDGSTGVAEPGLPEGLTVTELPGAPPVQPFVLGEARIVMQLFFETGAPFGDGALEARSGMDYGLFAYGRDGAPAWVRTMGPDIPTETFFRGASRDGTANVLTLLAAGVPTTVGDVPAPMRLGDGTVDGRFVAEIDPASGEVAHVRDELPASCVAPVPGGGCILFERALPDDAALVEEVIVEDAVHLTAAWMARDGTILSRMGLGAEPVDGLPTKGIGAPMDWVFGEGVAAAAVLVDGPAWLPDGTAVPAGDEVKYLLELDPDAGGRVVTSVRNGGLSHLVRVEDEYRFTVPIPERDAVATLGDGTTLEESGWVRVDAESGAVLQAHTYPDSGVSSANLSLPGGGARVRLRVGSSPSESVERAFDGALIPLGAPRGVQDLVAEYDAEGSLEFAVHGGGGIDVLPDGGFLLSTVTERDEIIELGGDTYRTEGRSDLLLAVFERDGTLRGVSHVGGPGRQRLADGLSGRRSLPRVFEGTVHTIHVSEPEDGPTQAWWTAYDGDLVPRWRLPIRGDVCDRAGCTVELPSFGSTTASRRFAIIQGFGPVSIMGGTYGVEDRWTHLLVTVDDSAP